MKAILVKVKTPNKMLFLKGKLSRTPFEAIINSQTELNILKSTMKLQNVEYEILSYTKPKKQPKPVKQKRRAPKIKTTEKIEPKTLLEKISNESTEQYRENI